MSVTLSSKTDFSKFCAMLEDVTNTRGAGNKIEIVKKFIQKCRNAGRQIKLENPDADTSLYPIFRLLLPNLERERGPHNLKEKSLAALYIRLFCLGKGSKEAAKLMHYKAPMSGISTGTDFAERAYSVLRGRLSQVTTHLTIEEINTFLDDIARRKEASGNKDDIFRTLLQQVEAIEFKWITRLILKDLKLGLSTKKILQVYHPEASERFDVSSDLRKLCEELHDPKEKLQHNVEVFSHFKPMLLERLRIEDADQLFVSNQQYFVQTKYDGERSQLHMKDGVFKYFTRQGYDITKNASYGENKWSGFLTGVIARLLNPGCRSIILDGELMGWNKQEKIFGSKGMNYDVKKLSVDSKHQPCFVAFDIVMYNDDLLQKMPYTDRWNLLMNAFREEEGCLIRCANTVVSNSAELLDIFNRSLKGGDEGIVLKRCDVPYKPNVREGSGCYKIKAEYSADLIQDVDLIILGGYYGEGKFTGMIKSFLMGVIDSGEGTSKFLSVVSVSSGISLEQSRKLWKKLEPHWLKQHPSNVVPPKDEPPDLWINPENSVIMSIRATEMIRSTGYPTGYTLRFPRVEQIREDKPRDSACTTTELLSLVKTKGVVQKLTKRSATKHDMEKDVIPKPKKVSKSLLSTIEGKPICVSAFSERPVPITRLFDGKEMCVINGKEEMSKEDIEHTLLLHNAEIIQHPRKETFCVIIGNDKTAKARNIIESNKYSVATIDWVERVTREENWSSLRNFLPWELLSMRESIRNSLAQEYDEYYDSFTVDADEESLLRSLKKVEDMMSNSEIDISDDIEQLELLDRELFLDNGVSPFSLFRTIIGYFDNAADCTKFIFRFMAGTVKETLDDSVPYIFVDSSSLHSNSGNRYRGRQENLSVSALKVICSQWIRDSFQNQILLPMSDYFVK